MAAHYVACVGKTWRKAIETTAAIYYQKTTVHPRCFWGLDAHRGKACMERAAMRGNRRCQAFFKNTDFKMKGP